MPLLSTHLMFQGEARQAIALYTSVFSDFSIQSMEEYGAGDEAVAGTIKTATVSFGQQRLIIIDSPIQHAFSFTPSVSLFVDFHREVELAATFALLSEAGEVMMPLDDYGFSRKFGWVADRFGVSWQLNLLLD